MKRRSFLGLAGAGLISQSTLMAANGCDMETEQALMKTEQERMASQLKSDKTADVPDMVATQILEYAKVLKKHGIATGTRAVAVPFSTIPLSMHMSRGEKLDGLPEPKHPLGWLVDQAANDEHFSSLLSVGMRYAMVDALPRWCEPRPFPAGGLPHMPRRIVSPKWTWDWDEASFDNTHERRVMIALACSTMGPVHEIRMMHKDVPVSLELAVDGLHCHVKKEAYMIELFSWCHVIEQSAIVEIPGGLQYENYC